LLWGEGRAVHPRPTIYCEESLTMRRFGLDTDKASRPLLFA
jgi:hypothetical protein